MFCCVVFLSVHKETSKIRFFYILVYIFVSDYDGEGKHGVYEYLSVCFI